MISAKKNSYITFDKNEIETTGIELEPVCLRNSKKSPNQETGLGNRGHLNVLKDIKLII